VETGTSRNNDTGIPVAHHDHGIHMSGGYPGLRIIALLRLPGDIASGMMERAPRAQLRVSSGFQPDSPLAFTVEVKDLDGILLSKGRADVKARVNRI